VIYHHPPRLGRFHAILYSCPEQTALHRVNTTTYTPDTLPEETFQSEGSDPKSEAYRRPQWPTVAGRCGGGGGPRDLLPNEGQRREKLPLLEYKELEALQI
jgi:hypothetical protein